MSETVASRKLYVKYSTEGDTSVSHSMPVSEDVTAEEVSTAADTIISKNVFGDKAGNLLSVAEAAYVRTISDRTLF